MSTARGYYREELRRAINNICMCLTHLERVEKAYKEYHPEISQSVYALITLLITIAETLEEIHDQI